MRPKFVVSVLVLLVCVLAVAFWLRPKHNIIMSTQLPETPLTTNQSLPSKMNVITQNTFHTSLPTNLSANQPDFVTHKRGTLEDLREIVKKQNISIEFYGKVIDQDSNAVSAAKIEIGIRHWTANDPALLFADSKQIELEQTSDADGRFEFHGETGDGFGVVITKDGYLSPPNARYGFGPKAGTFENPLIFKMWKIGEKVQLVSGSKFWGISPDGQTYTIDLLKQSKVESSNTPGDIRISIVRPTQIKPRTHFDWSFSIEAINGGLIKTDDEFIYLAPESGYQPSYQFTMLATNADWKGELDGLQFYLKSRDGQVYGRLTFDLIPNYNNVSIFNVNWAVNPNGSRNLQP